MKTLTMTFPHKIVYFNQIIHLKILFGHVTNIPPPKCLAFLSAEQKTASKHDARRRGALQEFAWLSSEGVDC